MLADRDALILVDVQRDFLPGGALPIQGGNEIIPVLNRWIGEADRQGVPIVASRDWHPPDHTSFEDRGGPWPRHCVQNTPGAEFASGLNLPDDALVVSKGTDRETDQYSAFEGSNLAETLRQQGILRLWVGGLAEDVCVRATVLDALEAGFELCLLAAATRPVTPAGGREAVREMRGAGAVIMHATGAVLEQDEGYE